MLIAGAPGSAAAAVLRQTVAEIAPVALGQAPDADRLEPARASFGFEMAWHVPAYAEWLDGADLTPAVELLARRVPEEPRVLADALLLEHLPELRAAVPHVRVVAVHGDVEEELADTVGLAMRARREATGDADAAALTKYWSWRIERWRGRRDDQLDPSADLVVAAGDVLAGPATVAREVSEATGLCQAG